MAKRKTKRGRRRGGGLARCKYVATRSTKRAANQLAGELKRDGFRSEVSKTYGGARLAYGVFSCGRPKR
jgi:hypothetical protein